MPQITTIEMKNGCCLSIEFIAYFMIKKLFTNLTEIDYSLAEPQTGAWVQLHKNSDVWPSWDFNNSTCPAWAPLLPTPDFQGMGSICTRYLCDLTPDSKVHGVNMGPIWGRQGPCEPHVGPMNSAILDYSPTPERSRRLS